MELLVPIRIEGREIDSDVTKPSHLLQPLGAVGRKVRRVGQDADRQAARKEKGAALLEKRIDRRLVVVGKENQDTATTDCDGLVDDRFKQLAASSPRDPAG